MTNINTYGLKMVGIEDVIAELETLFADAKNYESYDDYSYAYGRYQIFYNMDNGHVWEEFEGLDNNWTEYRGYPEIIHVMDTRTLLYPQELADAICDCVDEYNTYNDYFYGEG